MVRVLERPTLSPFVHIQVVPSTLCSLLVKELKTLFAHAQEACVAPTGHTKEGKCILETMLAFHKVEIRLKQWQVRVRVIPHGNEPVPAREVYRDTGLALTAYGSLCSKIGCRWCASNEDPSADACSSCCENYNSTRYGARAQETEGTQSFQKPLQNQFTAAHVFGSYVCQCITVTKDAILSSLRKSSWSARQVAFTLAHTGDVDCRRRSSQACDEYSHLIQFIRDFRICVQTWQSHFRLYFVGALERCVLQTT